MADKEPAKKKRRVKNPETFRERAEKAAEEKDQPKRSRRLKAAGGKVVKPVAVPVKEQSGRLYGALPKPVRKVLRVVGKVLFPTYFRKSWQELKLVTWPDWKTSRKLTFAVLVFAIIFGLAIAGVDWVLDKVFKAILLK